MEKKAQKFLLGLLIFTILINPLVDRNIVKASEGDRERKLQRVVDKALELEGMNYSSPHHHVNYGYNCDGLIWYAYKEGIGHLVPMGPENMDELGKEISKEDLRPGDVITYDFRNTGRATHVALYVGNLPGYEKPQIIHAVRNGDGYKGRGGVIIDDFDRYRPVKKYVRLYDETATRVADYRVKKWVNLRTNNGNQSYDREELIGRFRKGDIIKNAIDYGNFIRFEYNENATAFAIKSMLEQITPYRPYEGSLTEELHNGPIIPLKGSFWTSDTANVRSAPKGGVSLGKLPKGYFIEGEQYGKYYRFDYEGESGIVDGYIFDALLSKEKVRDKGIVIKDSYIVDEQGNKLKAVRSGDLVEGYLNNDYMEIKLPEGLGNLERTNIFFGKPKKFWVKEDTKLLYNIDGLEEVSEEELYKGLELSGVDMGEYYRVIPDNLTSMDGYVNKSDTSLKPIMVRARIKRDAKVGELGSDKTIGSIKRGEYINGNIIDGYFYFEYKGNYNAKVSFSDIDLNPMEPEEDYWLLEDADVLDKNEKVIGHLSKGNLIRARRYKNYYKFTYDLEGSLIDGYIHKDFVGTQPLNKDFYIKSRVNVRDSSAKIIGKLERGDRISAFKDGYYYKFTYLVDGKTIDGYVHENFVSESPMAKTVYIKNRVNVRDGAGNVIGKLQKGQLIEGEMKDDGFYFTHGSQEAKVHKNFISDKPVKGGAYILSKVNVRNEAGKVEGKLPKGKYIEASLRGNYFYFNQGEKTLRVHKNFAKFDSPVRGKINKNVNVRNANGEKINSKKAGDMVNVVRLGNYYRFFDKGQEAFIWHSFIDIN